jgi:PKD repeat protein
MEGNPLVTAKQVFSIIMLAALGVLLLTQPAQATPPEQMTVQFTGTPTIGYVPINVSFTSNAWEYTAYSFARGSIAYLDNGTWVGNNVGRFYANGLLIEESTTNLLGSNAPLTVDSNSDGSADGFGNWGTQNVAGTASVSAAGQRIEITGSTGTGGLWVPQTPTSTLNYPAAAGDVFSASWDAVYNGVAGFTGNFYLYFYDSANNSLGSITKTWTAAQIVNGRVYADNLGVAPANTVKVCVVLQGRTNGAGQSGYVVYKNLQVEKKAYCTSFINGARAGDVLTVPTTGVMSASHGTIEMLVNVTQQFKTAMPGNKYLFSHCTGVDGSTYYNVIAVLRTRDNDIIQLLIGDATAAYTYVSYSLASVSVGIHRLTFRWSASQASIWIDGVRVASMSNPKIPSAVAPLMYIGSWTSAIMQPNTQMSDFVLSNIYRSDADLAARGGLTPLGVDQYTTAYLPLLNQQNATWWDWNFGHGSPSSEQNPYHVYDVPGTYTVSLTAGVGSSSGWLQRIGYITVLSNPINPDFAVQQQGYVPLTVSPSHSGTNTTSWQWSWGDGSPNATTQNPTHEYAQPGTYTITLTASNAFYSSTMSKQVQVLAIPVTASFTANVTEGGLPLYVQFTDMSVNATSWQWQFGDGATSSEQNPAHLYTTAGRFTVKLTVSNAFSGDSSSTIVRVIAPDIFGPYNTSMRVPTFGGNGGGILQGIIDSIFPKDTDDFDLGTGLYYAGKPFSLNGIGDWWIVIVIITVAALILLSQGGSPFLLVMGLILGNAAIWVFIPMDWRSTIVVMATLTIAILILTLLRPGKER